MKALLLLPLLSWMLLGQANRAPDVSPLDAAQQRELLARISKIALRYQGHLPDFSCTQLTDRNRDDSGTGRQWKHQDTLEEAASYLNGQASFKLVKFNGRPPGRFHPFENGLGSQGVLSAALIPTHIFDARVHAQFSWVKTETFKEETPQGKQLYVFAYDVPPFLKLKQGSKEFTVGFHGVFSADPETALILTRHQEMDSPPGFHFPQYITDLEYGPVKLSDQEMFLPVKATENVRDGKHLMRNEIQFVNCRKYSADATVTFGDQK